MTRTFHKVSFEILFINFKIKVDVHQHGWLLLIVSKWDLIKLYFTRVWIVTMRSGVRLWYFREPFSKCFRYKTRSPNLVKICQILRAFDLRVESHRFNFFSVLLWSKFMVLLNVNLNLRKRTVVDRITHWAMWVVVLRKGARKKIVFSGVVRSVQIVVNTWHFSLQICAEDRSWISPLSILAS